MWVQNTSLTLIRQKTEQGSVSLTLWKKFYQNSRIPVYPTETCFRRFYIVKDNYETNFNIVSLKAYSESSDYKVKTVPDKVDNVEQIPDSNVMIEFFSNYPSGIIPFYLYIESTTTSYLEAELIIELEVN